MFLSLWEKNWNNEILLVQNHAPLEKMWKKASVHSERGRVKRWNLFSPTTLGLLLKLWELFSLSAIKAQVVIDGHKLSRLHSFSFLPLVMSVWTWWTFVFICFISDVLLCCGSLMTCLYLYVISGETVRMEQAGGFYMTTDLLLCWRHI